MYLTLTILAIAALLFFIVYGWGIVVRRGHDGGSGGMTACSICRKTFSRDLLVEREIGDYKLLYFCNECIEKLYGDRR
jgi:hypothetical protein